MDEKPKRIGRPTKAPKPGERVSLGLRVTADIKQKLDEAAARSGRSQSQEAELRLERSFEREELLPEVLTLAYGKSVADVFIHRRQHLVTLDVNSLSRFLDKAATPPALAQGQDEMEAGSPTRARSYRRKPRESVQRKKPTARAKEQRPKQ
jgi:uncharacterized protein (DUF1778 family)